MIGRIIFYLFFIVTAADSFFCTTFKAEIMRKIVNNRVFYLLRIIYAERSASK